MLSKASQISFRKNNSKKMFFLTRKKSKKSDFFHRNWWGNRLRVSSRIRITPKRLKLKVWTSSSFIDLQLAVSVHIKWLKIQCSHLSRKSLFKRWIENLRKTRLKKTCNIPLDESLSPLFNGENRSSLCCFYKTLHQKYDSQAFCRW